MAMVDMKLSKKEKKKETSEIPRGEGPEYPYGLSLNLHDREVRKLGIDMSKLKLSQSLKLTAQVEVTSMEVSDDMHSSRRNIRLQITKMDLDAPKGKGGGMTDKFFAKQGAGPGGKSE